MQAEEREQGRQHQLLGVLPLPRRVSPRPSEDLASVIVRTAHAMGYSEPGWILRPEKVAHVVAPGELALLRRRLDYELLMRLLDIDEATLYRLTLHRFAMCYEFPDWALISPEPPRRKVYSRELPLLHRLADYQVIERALGLGEAELHHMTLHCFAARLQSPESPACGGDYRRRLLPFALEANWVRDAHCVFLMHLGIEAAELGESPPSEARSLLQVLPSQEYFWIVSQFLEFLYERPYRGRLLPLLLRALPVENLAPTHIQSALLLLHYLLDSWPVHFWIALEHLQPALEEDSLWSHPSYAPARQWEAQLIRGAV